MLIEEKLHKISKHLENVKINLEQGNKQLALGGINSIEFLIVGAKYLLLSEIEEEDKF